MMFSTRIRISFILFLFCASFCHGDKAKERSLKKANWSSSWYSSSFDAQPEDKAKADAAADEDAVADADAAVDADADAAAEDEMAEDAVIARATDDEVIATDPVEEAVDADVVDDDSTPSVDVDAFDAAVEEEAVDAVEAAAADDGIVIPRIDVCHFHGKEIDFPYVPTDTSASTQSVFLRFHNSSSSSSSSSSNSSCDAFLGTSFDMQFQLEIVSFSADGLEEICANAENHPQLIMTQYTG